MSDEYLGGCLICGAPLTYFDAAKKMTCCVCGGEFESNACCENEHFICDECHARKSYSIIRYICSNTYSKNPIEIANKIIDSKAVHTHGPEYHVLVGSVLLAAYKNAGGDVDFESALKAVELRGKQVPGGFCGFAGACGAGISAGIFLCAALKVNPLCVESWALANKLTSECLNEISKHGGPRCCKRDAYSSIIVATGFVHEHLGIKLELPNAVVCAHSKDNNECLKEDCPYYPK